MEGDKVAIKSVRAFPPKESCSSRVSLDSLQPKSVNRSDHSTLNWFTYTARDSYLSHFQHSLLKKKYTFQACEDYLTKLFSTAETVVLIY